VYLEGMPAGSLTALLEVCLAGVPCVRSPARVRPPHASDGIALASVAQPTDIPAYVNEAVALAEDAKLRRERGSTLQRAVREYHCEAGWRRQLEHVLPSLPGVHAVYPDQSPRPIAREESDYKLDYAYHDVTRGRTGLLATLVAQAVRSCAEARLAVAAALPKALANSNTCSLESVLSQAILPELRERLVGADAGAERRVLEQGVLAKELMVLLARDGRRGVAWRFAKQMALRSPAIVNHVDFRKGLIKSLPGSAALVRLAKSRRK